MEAGYATKLLLHQVKQLEVAVATGMQFQPPGTHLLDIDRLGVGGDFFLLHKVADNQP